jgi:hypothetical protein
MLGRRKKDDVFVIGDELSEAETKVLEDPAAPAGDQAPGGHPQPSGLGRAASSGARRGLAALAIAGPLAALGVLLSSLGTSGGSKDHTASPSRSALVQGPAPRAAKPPAPAGPLLPDGRRVMSREGDRPPRPDSAEATEPERESSESEAPESSAPVSALPAAASVPSPAPQPPSPPPSSSGGGPGGTERFGFER